MERGHRRLGIRQGSLTRQRHTALGPNIVRMLASPRGPSKRTFSKQRRRPSTATHALKHAAHLRGAVGGFPQASKLRWFLDDITFFPFLSEKQRFVRTCVRACACMRAFSESCVAGWRTLALPHAHVCLCMPISTHCAYSGR